MTTIEPTKHRAATSLQRSLGGILHTHSDQRVRVLVFLKQGNCEETLAGGFARLIIHVCLPPQRDGKEIEERDHGDSSSFCSIGWINEATGGLRSHFLAACVRGPTRTYTHIHVYAHWHTGTEGKPYLSGFISAKWSRDYSMIF